MIKIDLYRRIAEYLPAKFINAFRAELIYLRRDVEPMRFAGFIFIFGLLLSIAIGLNVMIFFDYSFAITFAVSFVMWFIMVYLWLSLAADSRGRFVEKILPDALQLMSANIRSGITAEKSLFLTARPEFGPLENELKVAAKSVFAGERLENALLQIPKYIKSKSLERTFWLITKGIQSGGELADLLIQIAEDLREEQNIKDEIRANVSLYSMLIFFAAAIGAPLLFAVSSFIVQVLVHFTTMAAPTAAVVSSTGRAVGGTLIGIPQTKIDPGFVIMFSIIMLGLSSMFASFTIGIINTGKERNGTKYIPILFLVSLAVFYLIRYFLTIFFGQLI